MPNNNDKFKIAVVHDHLGWPGGGERTALTIALELDADFITAYANADTYPDYQKRLGRRLKTFSKKVIELEVVRFFWLRGLFWRNRKMLGEYDILIASGQAATEAAAQYGKQGARKILYNHTPPRRIYDLYQESRQGYKWFLRPLYTLFACYWRWLYLRAAQRFDVNIANSENIRQRARKYTNGDVNAIIWPPVLTDKFRWISQGDYFLSYARVDEHKRVELIAKAFKKMPEEKLIIASSGSRLEAVRALAVDCPNITVLGQVTDEQLFDLVGNCRACVYIPINEDAGITQLEANAAGKPVLGVAEGGLLETIIDGETGKLIKSNPSEDDIIAAVREMPPEWCLARKDKCAGHAKRYDQAEFCRKIKDIVLKNNPCKPVIGIDASRLEDPRYPGEGRRTGVEVYAWNIINNLIPLINENEYIIRIYTPRLIAQLPLAMQKVIPGARQWTRKHLSRELKYLPPDYFFTPSYYIPKTAPLNSFAVIHDVIFKTNPEAYSFRDRLAQNYAARLNIKRAKKLITVSEYSKQEIASAYQIHPEKIISAPMGYGRWPNISRGSTREKIILFIGRIDKKKSIDVLIKAFALLKHKLPGWKLILAGGRGYGFKEIKSLVAELNLSDRVETPGYVSDQEKMDLLAKASLYVHPSSLEGSCIPLFEAWDAETPAIAADTPLFREIGQGAALLFKAGGEQDLAEKIIMLAEDAGLRNDLVEKGRENLLNMPWSKTAETVLETILKIRLLNNSLYL